MFNDVCKWDLLPLKGAWIGGRKKHSLQIKENINKQRMCSEFWLRKCRLYIHARIWATITHPLTFSLPSIPQRENILFPTWVLPECRLSSWRRKRSGVNLLSVTPCWRPLESSCIRRRSNTTSSQPEREREQYANSEQEHWYRVHYCKSGNIGGAFIFANFEQNSASANLKTRKNICDIVYAHFEHVGVVNWPAVLMQIGNILEHVWGLLWNQDFLLGGGGGGVRKRLYVRPHIRALWVFDALSCYLSLIFKHSDTKWDKKNSQSNFFWGARLLRPPLNPPLLITNVSLI